MNPVIRPDTFARESTASSVGSVYILPSVGLPYMHALRKAVADEGLSVTVSAVFPRRGILFDQPITALHLHMLETIFTGKTHLATIARIWWFRFVLVPMMKLRRINLVWTCHEMAAHENDPSGIAVRMARVMTYAADTVVVHNRAIAARLIERYPHVVAKVAVLPHGDLAPFYREHGEGVAFDNQLAHGPTFVSVGYMRRIKGNDIVLRAFSRLKAASARLAMVGVCIESDMRADLEELARADHRVTLDFRPLTEAEVIAIHADALAAVFAFRDCPTTGSVITAMSLGCAVIGPSVGHMAELVDDSSGWLVDPDAIEEGLVSAMRQALSYPDVSREKGRAGQARMARDDWPTIASALVDIYVRGPEDHLRT